MSNLIYTKFLSEVAKGNIDLDAAGTVMRVMLERSTSTYSPNKDHDFVSDLAGFVEISVSGYSRQTLASKAVNKDDTNDRAEFDCDDVSFGSLPGGQTVKAIILYVQVGGDDSTPNDDILVCRIDTDSNSLLPAPLGGGSFDITINTEGLIQFSQP